MKKRILVISKGLFHPSLACRAELKNTLNEYSDSFDFIYSNKLTGIERLKEDTFSGIILFFHEKELKEYLLGILNVFIARGGHIFAIHGAMASFKTNKEYQELLGGKFIAHGEIGKFTVSNGSTSFEVYDELYIHEYDASNKILLTSDYLGKPEPVMWIKDKVTYLSLGHCPSTFRNPEVKEVLYGVLDSIKEDEGAL